MRLRLSFHFIHIHTMNKFFTLISTAAIALFATACDENDDKAELYATQTSFTADGGLATLHVSSNGTWVISSSQSWLTLSAAYGDGDTELTMVVASSTDTVARQAIVTLTSGMSADVVTISQDKFVVPAEPEQPTNPDQPTEPSEPADTENKNANSTALNAEAGRLEIPALNSSNYFVSHYATVAGNEEVNYSIEWNNSMKHAQWAAFVFDKNNCAKNVSRSEEFYEDTDLPAEMRTNNSYFTSDGFDRGHLCASDDRVYSRATNDQTFYYSNMSPQLNEFNSGIWQAMEFRVQTWGRSTASGTFDTVYVAKGGTLNELLINFTGSKKGNDSVLPTTNDKGYTIKGLPCPAYYFMAILAVKNGKYSAIGFLAPHSQDIKPANGNDFTSAELKSYALSIDDLEDLVDLDFFCNLTDATEDAVEANLDLTQWAW